MKKYNGWVLVTGASSGIGREFAIRFAKEGYDVIILARRLDRLTKLAQEIQAKFNVKCLIANVDLGEINFLEKLLTTIGEREVAVLVNNAGFGSTGEFIRCDSQREINMLKVNCIAPLILTHHFAKKMAEKKNGLIIFVGSVVGYQPTPLMSTYSATKSFNIFLGNALWWELKKHSVDVLTVNPGGTETEFQRIASSPIGFKPRKPSDVVNTTFNAIGKKFNVVDGLLNKFQTSLTKLIPRRILINLIGFISSWLYKSM
ncbi:SDR family NAD(P)-dependent oxidoreductase [Melioribacteraceae bacterium 4301-Me]|uniref:SDR family NAD(P)-dependent oxidoreductase n=1 Tax=Pyranulibacter aquaticus TaxID=3163344 RepID=UPI0035984253